MSDDFDETACDHCGCQTPRLDPPEPIELCMECWRKQRAENERIIGQHIREWLDSPFGSPEGGR